MKSIRKRLNVTYGLLILASFIFLGFFLLMQLEDYFLKQSKANLAPQVKMAGYLVHPLLIHKDYTELNKLVHKIGKENDIRITVILPGGKVVADSEHDYRSMDNHLGRPEIQKALHENIGYSMRMSDTIKQKLLYCAYKLKDKGVVVGFVRIAVSLRHIDEIYAYLKRILFEALAVVAIIALYAGAKTAESITTPISHLKKAAEEIAQGNLKVQAKITSDDELADLAHAINTMAQKFNLYVKSINAEKEQLEIIFQHLSAGVVVINSSGRILLVNTFAERIFNVSRSLVEEQPLKALIRDEGFTKEFELVAESNIDRDYIFEYDHNYLQVHFVPIQHSLGEKKIVILIYDITPLKKWQQIRSDFVANASHELRTPLTAIRGYTETLLDGAMDDKETARSFLEIIEHESERLARIVEDLLDLSKLERTIPLNKESFLLKELCEKVAVNFLAAIEAKGISFETKIPDGMVVYADYDWLEQVLVNLFDNAIKYSKQNGKIKVSACEKENESLIKISDTGIGIPYGDLPRIFERFYRVDKSRSRSLGGTGLGLAIVKHVIESHQGKVFVESTLGEGTTISFTLPKRLT